MLLYSAWHHAATHLPAMYYTRPTDLQEPTYFTNSMESAAAASQDAWQADVQCALPNESRALGDTSGTMRDCTLMVHAAQWLLSLIAFW